MTAPLSAVSKRSTRGKKTSTFLLAGVSVFSMPSDTSLGSLLVPSSCTLTTTMAAAGVSAVRLSLPTTAPRRAVPWICTNKIVYGIMILIGTVIGCIAGIPSVDGYTGKLPTIQRTTA